MIDFVTIAAGVVKVLQPALPYLDPLKTTLQKKISDATAVAAFDQAKSLWAKITSRFKDDKALNEAADRVVRNADDTDEDVKTLYRDKLTKVLAERLKDSPELAEELLGLLGGEKRLQEIVAGDSATIRKINQTMAGPGKQSTKAGNNCVIEDVTQKQTL